MVGSVLKNKMPKKNYANFSDFRLRWVPSEIVSHATVALLSRSKFNIKNGRSLKTI